MARRSGSTRSIPRPPRASRPGALSRAPDDDPVRQGPGRIERPGSAASPSGGAATGGADNYLAQRGYIEIVEDVRGTGDSGGSWGLFDPIQQQDAIQVLHWAAHLPHSDGRVGTYGPSYLGIDQMLLAGAVGRHSPLKAIFPMVTANDVYRDTSFMGGLIDFEFDEAYLGLTAGTNTENPVSDSASDPALLADLAAIEADHADGLATYHAGQTKNILLGGAEAYDGSYWQARNPQNVIRGSSPTTFPPTSSAASSTSSSAASRPTTPSSRTPGMAAASPRRCARPADDRPLPADRRPLGAPQRFERRRRPAGARVVRHLAQARAHRHGPDPHSAALLRPRHRPVPGDHHLSVHGRDADAHVPRRGRHAQPVGAAARSQPATR